MALQVYTHLCENPFHSFYIPSQNHYFRFIPLLSFSRSSSQTMTSLLK